MSTSSSLALRVWRDGAVRSLPVWLLIALATGNALAAVIVLRAVRAGTAQVPPYQLILTLWLPITIYLLFGRTRARCHRLDLALPIPARELWLSHSIALVFAAATILATVGGLLAGNSLLLTRLTHSQATGLGLQALLPPIAAALLLAIVLVQQFQPGSWKLLGDARYWTLLVVGLAAILACLLLLSSRPWVATSLFLVLAALLARRVWSSLPPSFELTPEDGKARGDARVAGAEQALASAPVGTATILRILFKVLHNAPPWRQAMPFVFYSFVLLMGFFLSGALEIWVDAGEARSMNLPLGSYILFAGAGLLTYQLYRLDSLPIRRRTLFHILTLPTLLIFCLGWAGGRLLLATADPRPLVEYRIAGAQQWVEVDPGFMELSTTGETAILTSPWGESHAARQQPLFRGSSASLYSPFNTPEKSSARFEALMTSRAIERIYGEVIPYTEILERYFQVEGDDLVGLVGGGLTLLADYPELAAPPRGPETPFYLAVILVPWLLLLALFARSFRATSSVRLIRWVYWAGLLALMSLLIGQLVLSLAGGYDPEAAHGFLEIFVRWLGSHPLAPAAIWTGGLAAIVLAYRLAQEQFRRAELPTTPIQCALVDWGRSD